MDPWLSVRWKFLWDSYPDAKFVVIKALLKFQVKRSTVGGGMLLRTTSQRGIWIIILRTIPASLKAMQRLSLIAEISKKFKQYIARGNINWELAWETERYH